MTVRQLIGDCREILRNLPTESIQSCITSPPYYGLRDYGTDPLVWGGDAGHAHDFEPVHRLQRSGVNHDGGAGYRPREDRRYVVRSDLCICGAWRGSLGLEPTPELFIEHLVEVFRDVKRVLRPDGTLWVNLGDSYAGSGKGPSNSVQGEASQIGPSARSKQTTNSGSLITPSLVRVPGYKNKDLMMMPARVALALQADGWWLRSMIPWLKRNSMPESVTDRPASAVEYWFLFAKSSRYFWDADAVRIVGREWGARDRSNGVTRDNSYRANGHPPHKGLETVSAGRNRRNSDWFFESWQGLMLDEDDAPMALVVNPTGFKESHFATFPPKLVEPLIRASTSERGQCPECGAPWVRVVDRSPMVVEPSLRRTEAMENGSGRGRTATSGTMTQAPTSATTGWRPSCAHTDSEPVPQTVIDCFGGAGTVGLVADRLGRDAILIDLKDDYAAMAHRRLTKEGAQVVMDHETSSKVWNASTKALLANVQKIAETTQRLNTDSTRLLTYLAWKDDAA